ncbi:MAG: VOC family protein [Chloroflexota bacterium]
MITKVGTVSLFVNDQDDAKAFYTEKLGFEVRMDVPFGPDSRWLSVAPPGAETEVILYKPDENWEHYRQVIGKSQALTFSVNEIEAFVAEVSAKGVRVPMGIMDEGWGRHAFILDHEDNMLLVVQDAPPQG